MSEDYTPTMSSDEVRARRTARVTGRRYPTRCTGEPCRCTGAELWSGACEGDGQGGSSSELAFWGDQFD